jgi:hypothetical protein
MQTFLPYADYSKTAKVLDMKRLGKQRVETFQVLKALLLENYGWKQHPAVKMWRGHTYELLEYQKAICNEWTSRGYKDTCLEKSIDFVRQHCHDLTTAAPSWLGNEEIHLSHRSNLIRKAPDIYIPIFGSDVPNDLEYVWPI